MSLTEKKSYSLLKQLFFSGFSNLLGESPNGFLGPCVVFRRRCGVQGNNVLDLVSVSDVEFSV